MDSSDGRFVWYELTTTDIEAAKAFYAKVVGWRARDGSIPGLAYALFTVGGTAVSGLMGLPEDARKLGARPRWIGYVGVSNVDAAADRLTQLGGTVHVPPTEIPNFSRFSVVSDPQMATLALFKWLKPDCEQPAALDAPGRIGWHELAAADCDKALVFYGELFGWRQDATGADATGAYQTFSAGDQPIGGMFTKPASVPVPFWLYYFNVGDIDLAVKRVKAAQGQVLSGPIEVPDGSWIAECTDPQGAVFALVGKRPGDPVGYFRRIERSPAATARRKSPAASLFVGGEEPATTMTVATQEPW